MGYISEVTNAKDVITLGSGSFDDGIFEFSFSATMNVYSSKSYEWPGLFSKCSERRLRNQIDEQ